MCRLSAAGGWQVGNFLSLDKKRLQTNLSVEKVLKIHEKQ